MQADTDYFLDDEQFYKNYISNLSLRKAFTNYIQARTYEPAVMLGYGVLLAAKTPTYLVFPGAASRCWKKYFMFFKALGVKCEITRKELSMKLKQMRKSDAGRVEA